MALASVRLADEAARERELLTDLLTDVKTSQGIRVRLDWSLREDAGQDVHDAVALLGRAHGSLTQEGPASWDKEVASMHYLLRCARLMALLATGNRRTEALREVRRARGFIGSVAGTPAALTGTNAPAHLTEWERLLI